MMCKKLVLILSILILPTASLLAQEEPQVAAESDQQISDFSLSGYGEKGKKTWDLAGKSADIFTDTVKLNEVVGNMYGKDENIKLTADRGDFNKTDGKVRLEQNVVITTSSGTKLNTNSLDWDRKNQMVKTDDTVNIERDNMNIVALGAKGEPNLKKVALEKDVKLDINAKEPDPFNASGGQAEKIMVTCDGPVEIDYEKNLASFKNKVKVERQESTIYSDRMDIYFITKKNKEESQGQAQDKSSSFMGSSVDKIVARGNVRVVRGENTSYSEEAIYSASDKKLTLTGRPKLVIYSTESLSNASSGN